jgi:hypothetical protein
MAALTQRLSNFNQSQKSPTDDQDDTISVSLSEEMQKWETYSQNSLQDDIEMYAYGLDENERSRARLQEYLQMAKAHGANIKPMKDKINELRSVLTEDDIGELTRKILLNEGTGIAKELSFQTPIPVRKGRSRAASKASIGTILEGIPMKPSDMSDSMRQLNMAMMELGGVDKPSEVASAPRASKPERGKKQPRKQLVAQTPSKKAGIPLTWLTEFRDKVKKTGNESFTASRQKNRDLIQRLIAELSATAPRGYPTGSWKLLMDTHQAIKTNDGKVFTWNEAQRDAYFRQYQDTIGGMKDQLDELK